MATTAPVLPTIPDVLPVQLARALRSSSSGSTTPAAAMDEWGIDLSQEFPKPLTDDEVVRRIRDDIDARVQHLLSELVPASA